MLSVWQKWAGRLGVDGATDMLELIQTTAAPVGGAHPDVTAHAAMGLSTGLDLAGHVATGHVHNHDAAYSGTAHGHVEGDVTSLASDLAGKAATGHVHAYAASVHAHAEAEVTSLAADLAAKASTTHNHDSAYATAGHVHASSQAFPVGAMFLSAVSTNPATLLGYGTWSEVGRGKFLVGEDAATFVAGQTGGATTHAHALTEPADHAALAHSGTAVANHVVTQPAAHAGHVVTQPGAHSPHVVTQPTAATEAAHTHTGASAGTTPKLVTSNTSTGVPLVTGGGTAHTHVLTGAAVDAHSAHAGAAVDAHSAHSGAAVDAHAVTQPGQHAAQAHSGGAVVDGSTVPPFLAVFIWQRTA